MRIKLNGYRLLSLGLCRGIALALAGVTTPVWAQPIEVRLDVTNLRNNHGQVLVAAHASSESFPSQWDKATALVVAPARSPNLSVRIKLPKAGRYAIIVLHDEDGDGRMAKNFFRLPREGFVTGNNPKALEFPRFERSSLSLRDATSVLLNMFYP